MDVLVAGAGPTGLALACGLLSRGVSVRVVDRASGPSVTSRALGLQARGAEVLDRLGALGNLPERSVKVMGVQIRIDGRQVARMRVGDWAGRTGRPALIISQAEVEAQLRQRLADLGGKVEWGVEVVGVQQDDTGVDVALAGQDGTTERGVRAAWLVGCDGAHSTVRVLAGVGFPGVRIAERFLLADVHLDWTLPRQDTVVWLHPAGTLAAFPLPGTDRWRLMVDVEDGTPDDTKGNAELAEAAVLARFQQLLPARTGLTGARIQRAVWTSTFRIHRRLADTYRSGRILLAGDAAHIHSPAGGQGMNTGLGDAENLVWKLALVVQGRAVASLLDSYQAERRPVAEDVLAGTSAVTRLVFSANPLVRLLRDQVVMPLLNLPAVRDRIMARASQLGVHYRGGPLARPVSVLAGPRPGDRVADLPCRRPDGRPTRLHAELGGGWALLVTDLTDPCVAAARQRLAEDLVVLVPTRPMARTMLVRPDGHLAWRGRPSPARLGRWLDEVLTRGQVRASR